MAEATTQDDNNSKLVGLLAQFDDPTSLVHACDEARKAGYKKMDAFSPFPVHGIDPAIGIKRSYLPFIVLAFALGAVVVGLGLQLYTNAFDTQTPFPGYKFRISGKPLLSIPANIPVTFEIIVLTSAFATFFGMWILNKLPMFSNPLHRIARFKRATNDKFFLMLEAADDKFSVSDSEGHLNGWGAVAVEEVRQDLTDTALPKWLPTLGVLGFIILLLPPAAIFSQWGQTNRRPRLHVVPDMDWQHKFKAQTMSPNLANGLDEVELLFNDFRSARRPVEGSIPFGSLDVDTELNYGVKKDFAYTVGAVSGMRTSAKVADDKEEPASDAAAAAPEEENLAKYVTEFPEGITVDEKLLKRGQQRFNIYCAACHGYAGQGNGQVNKRALALAANGGATWTAARSLHDTDIKDDAKNPVGRIYDTIANGRNNMGPYKAQIVVEDRWAIVAYVKALQSTGIRTPGGDQSAADGDADGDSATDEVKESTDESETAKPDETKADEPESDKSTADEPTADEPTAKTEDSKPKQEEPALTDPNSEEAKADAEEGEEATTEQPDASQDDDAPEL